jgi:hypothetical protein
LVDAVGRIAIFGEFGNVVSTRCVADKGAVGRAIHTIRRITLFGRKIDKPVSADRYALAGIVACRGTRRLTFLSGVQIAIPTTFQLTGRGTVKYGVDGTRRIAFFSRGRSGHPVSAKQSGAVGATIDTIRWVTLFGCVDVSIATNRNALTSAVTRRGTRRLTFLSGINIAIPTARELTGRGTVKDGVDGTRRIAFFRPVVVDRPIATKFNLAETRASIAADDISVVTFFGRRVQMSVSADRDSLTRRVAKHRTGRLTFLSRSDNAVSAAQKHTVVGAIEHWVDDRAWRFALFIGSDGPIAALDGAIGTAPIIVDVVAVVALFPGLVDHPVATTGFEFTHGRASIPIYGVAIVTLFWDFKDTIATGLRITSIPQAVSVEVFLAWIVYSRTIVANIPDTVRIYIALIRIRRIYAIINGVRHTIIVEVSTKPVSSNIGDIGERFLSCLHQQSTDHFALPARMRFWVCVTVESGTVGCTEPKQRVLVRAIVVSIIVVSTVVVSVSIVVWLLANSFKLAAMPLPRGREPVGRAPALC